MCRSMHAPAAEWKLKLYAQLVALRLLHDAATLSIGQNFTPISLDQRGDEDASEHGQSQPESDQDQDEEIEKDKPHPPMGGDEDSGG